MTANHLEYKVKGELEVCKDYDQFKMKHNTLHKVSKERHPNPGNIIYIDTSIQKNQVMEVQRILLYSKTHASRKIVFLYEYKIIINIKFHPFIQILEN